MDQLKWEIAQAAAAKIVDDGKPWSTAKRQAAQDLGLPVRTALPGNDLVLQAVREHIVLFCPQQQAQALALLRDLALRWMRRMSAYRPHLSGAVWLGVATRWSDVHLDLYCDDLKMPAIDLLNQGVDFDTGETPGARGQSVPQLIVLQRVADWPQPVSVVMSLHDADDLRGALQAHKSAQAPRGDLDAVLGRITAEASGGG